MNTPLTLSPPVGPLYPPQVPIFSGFTTDYLNMNAGFKASPGYNFCFCMDLGIMEAEQLNSIDNHLDDLENRSRELRGYL